MQYRYCTVYENTDLFQFLFYCFEIICVVVRERSSMARRNSSFRCFCGTPRHNYRVSLVSLRLFWVFCNASYPVFSSSNCCGLSVLHFFWYQKDPDTGNTENNKISRLRSSNSFLMPNFAIEYGNLYFLNGNQTDACFQLSLKATTVL